MGFRDVAGPVEACPGCQAEVAAGTRICPSCGGPVDIGQHAELELKLKPDLRKARYILGIVTGLGALSLLFQMASTGRSAWSNELFDVAFYGVCFVLAKRWPLGTCITAMSVFLFAQAAVLGAGNIQAVVSGLVLKVIVVVLLSAGIRAGYRIRDLRGQWSRRARNVGIAAFAGSTLLGFLLGLLWG